MTTQEKQRVIEILEYYGNLIGTDKEETTELAKKVDQIYITDKDLTIEAAIQNEMFRLCAIIGYEITDENNKSRQGERVPMRDAVAKRIVEEYDGYSRLPTVLGLFFGKDRSTGNAMIVRSQIRLEAKDELFMRHYNRTFEQMEAA
jgi:hypothetical protein